MDNLKTSFFRTVKFSNEEILTMLLTSFVTGLVLFLNDWSYTSYTVKEGILRTIVYFVLAFLVVYTSLDIQKKAGGKLGYKLTYFCNKTQAMSAAFFSLVSAGWLMLTTPGILVMKADTNARAGQVQAGVNNFDRAKIILAGVAYLMLLMILSLVFFGDNEFMLNVNKVILFLGLFMLVPIPSNPGLYLLMWNKIIAFIVFLAWLLLGVLALPSPELLVNMVIGGVVLGLVSALELLPRITIFR